MQACRYGHWKVMQTLLLFKYNEDQDVDQDSSFYSRFYISGRDIAAFILDCRFDGLDYSLISPPGDYHPSRAAEDCVDNFCSLVDSCGMAVIVDQGIGHSIATWKPSCIALVGCYLYVLKSGSAPSYERSTRGTDIQKGGEEDQAMQEETIIVELLAGGGKIHVARSEGDLSVKMKLHYLRIKDKLFIHATDKTQYLAFSVTKDDHTPLVPTSLYSQANQSLMLHEEEDIFGDAPEEFIVTPDTSSSHNLVPDSSEVVLSNLEHAKGGGSNSEIFYEALGSDHSDFVSVTFIRRDPSSIEYDGIDTHV